MIDRVSIVRLREILNIDRPSVMISKHGEHFDVGVRPKRIFESLSDISGILCDLFVTFSPNIVSRVVSSPSNKLGSELILIVSYEVKHSFEGTMRNIAVVVSPPG